MRKKCVFKKSEGEGAELYWFESCHTGDPAFDDQYVSLYAKKDGKVPSAVLHRSRIQEVPDDVPSQRKWGREYPHEEWLKSFWDVE